MAEAVKGGDDVLALHDELKKITGTVESVPMPLETRASKDKIVVLENGLKVTTSANGEEILLIWDGNRVSKLSNLRADLAPQVTERSLVALLMQEASDKNTLIHLSTAKDSSPSALSAKRLLLGPVHKMRLQLSEDDVDAFLTRLSKLVDNRVRSENGITPVELSQLLNEVSEDRIKWSSVSVLPFGPDGVRVQNKISSNTNSYYLRLSSLNNEARWSFDFPNLDEIIEKLALFKTKHGSLIQRKSNGEAGSEIAFSDARFGFLDPNPSYSPREDKVFYVVNGKVKQIQLMTNMFVGHMSEDVDDLARVASVEQVIVDKSGAYFVVKHAIATQQWITIFRRADKNIVLTKNVDMASPMTLDNQGTIWFTNSNGTIQKLDTNMSASFSTEQLKEVYTGPIASFQEKIQSITLDGSNFIVGGGVENDWKMLGEVIPTVKEELTKELEAKLLEVFGPALDVAKTMEELDPIREKITALSVTNELKHFSAAFHAIRTKLIEKGLLFVGKRVSEEVQALVVEAKATTSLLQKMGVKEKYQNLLKENDSETLESFSSEDQQKIEAGFEEIQRILSTMEKEQTEELLQRIPELSQKAIEVINSCQTAKELDAANMHPTMVEFITALNLVNDIPKRRELGNDVRTARREKSLELSKKRKEQEEHTRKEEEKLMLEMEENLETIRNELAVLLAENNGELDANTWFDTTPWTHLFGIQLYSLSESKRLPYEAAFKNIVKEAKQKYEQEKVQHKEVVRQETIMFGRESFPVYIEQPAHLRAKWLPDYATDDKGKKIVFSELPPAEWPKYSGRLKFVTAAGKEWISSESMKMDLKDSDEKYKQLKEKATKALIPVREVPPLNPRFRLSDYQVEIFERMALCFKLQLDLPVDSIKDPEQIPQPKGLLIMQGDAGAGKDFSIDAFAHMINYEVVNIPCRRAMDPSDLTSEYRFNPKKGTFRVPSRFIQALTRPGVLFNFIEINTLPPDVSKMLNTLFDGRRTIYFTEGEDPDSVELNTNGIGSQVTPPKKNLFVGSMNPEYIGTTPLPQEFVDRALMMSVDYPPYRMGIKDDGTRVRLLAEETTGNGYKEIRIVPDEAYIQAENMPALRSLNKDDFDQLWNYYFNKKFDNGGDSIDNPERNKEMVVLNKVLLLANKVRQAYKAYKNGGTEPVEFIFSMRTTEYILKAYQRFKDVKQAVEFVVMPKITDARQKELIEQLMEAVFKSSDAKI